MQEKVADRVGGSPPVFDAPAPHSHSSGPIIAASEASTQSPADKHCEHMTSRRWVMRVIVTGSALTDFRHMSLSGRP